MSIRSTLDNLPEDIQEQVISITTSTPFKENGKHIMFRNGYVLSVQWGYGSYSDNYDMVVSDIASLPHSAVDSETSEVAYWKIGGELIHFEDGDNVQGYQTVEQVLAHCRRIMTLEGVTR